MCVIKFESDKPRRVSSRDSRRASGYRRVLCHCVRRLAVTVARGPCQTPVTVGRPVTVVDFSRIYAPQCRVGRPGIRFFLARRFLGGSLLTSRIVAPSPMVVAGPGDGLLVGHRPMVLDFGLACKRDLLVNRRLT